jgi:hypothetical protein
VNLFQCQVIYSECKPSNPLGAIILGNNKAIRIVASSCYTRRAHAASARVSIHQNLVRRV